ncbi:pyridoxal-phosphate dependent enzyme-domain-containing protein [Lineolata rhizophorae]|uniref:Pyridoxal-phosphate dependent enzyme-domain-containing protein n=1 Tax=Lineolata rhizophorae TaxID=578093 RepID=A0A6A6P398_9PEZI|nr:pyridoxal-phosphate dependent enzyme-domain-containing protein [Lineolata rhizophorae]
MADITTCPPLTRESVRAAHERIKPYIHLTPVLTNRTLDDIASTPQSAEALRSTQFEGEEPASPKIRFFFKCENLQRVGAFKVRGAFHALTRLREVKGREGLKKGVITHSSGNHAQALSLAARTFRIPAHIVMPTISTPSKIAATRSYGAHIHFSGSTSSEREAAVATVLASDAQGATLVPPYDHPDIMLGQGTMALELEAQVHGLLVERRVHAELQGQTPVAAAEKEEDVGSGALDAVITPCGGGGMLSGVATALAGTGTKIFGAEPEFEGADDAKRGVERRERIESVKSLTIADGLRTPLGVHTWEVISDEEKVQGLYSVSEEQIKAAMRLVLERMKVVVEPSAVVGLAVCLFNEEFRKMVETEAGDEGWNVGVVLSGGNTTVDAISKLFGADASEKEKERQEGVMSMGGGKVAENIAG